MIKNVAKVCFANNSIVKVVQKGKETEITLMWLMFGRKEWTCESVDLLVGKISTNEKWIFKLKMKPDGFIAKHKARLEVEEVFFKSGALILMKSLHQLQDWKQLDLL